MDYKNIDQKSVRTLMITRSITIVGVVAAIAWAFVKVNTVK